MIGMVPGTMQVVTGGVEVQARLALRHVSRVITAVVATSDIRAVVQVCGCVGVDGRVAVISLVF